MRKNILLFVALAVVSCNAPEEGGDVRLSWDGASYHEITEINVANAGFTEYNLCYPRIKRLSDGALLLSFMDQHYGYNIYTARSEDDGATWSDAVLVREQREAVSSLGEDKIVYVNPDFIELQDGRVILAWQWRYLRGYGDIPNTNNNCGVEIAFSSNKGRSWEGCREVFRGRCWEPAFLQLPSGELHMYITSSQDVVDGTSYPRTIVLRSFDGGETWQGKPCCGIGDVETISRTVDERFAYDGMPTAVCLKDGRGIAVPLEVWHGKMVVDQTPVVIKSSMATNWRRDNEEILRSGGPAFPDKKEVNKDFQGYGPYCTILPEGEMIVLSNGTYKGQQGVWIFVGNADADDFYYASSPFDGYWGCIDYVGDSKVIACAGEKYSKDGQTRYKIKYMTARLNRSRVLSKGVLRLCGLSDLDASGMWFLGRKAGSCMYADFGYTSEAFQMAAYVLDNNIVAFTPENSDAAVALISRGKAGAYDNYQVIVNAEGRAIVYREYTRSWHKVWEDNVPVELCGTVNDASDCDLGYAALVQVPWDVLGGRPRRGEILRAHIRRHIKDKPAEKPLSTLEDLPGASTDHPSDWLKLTLR